ncbi:hypothetical protein [Methanolobus sp. WCC4]|uniref:hypothetical protein n=1 Tax=Methanolobus sp. WCC4 TaxID=3125784 RepID=UPI0030FC96D9
MVKIFKRSEEKKILPDEGKAQLAEASRRLGFEVGYHRHSEIGWVQEKLTQINRFADVYDLRDLVKEHYNLGKEEGSRSKDRDTKTGLSRPSSPEKPEKPPSVTVERPKNGFTSHNVSSYRAPETVISGSSDMTLQPGLVDLPDNIERTKAIEMPSFLDGIKHLTPKKK